MSSPPPLTPEPLPELVASFRFMVTFLTGGAVVNPIDIRFQRVSGLASEIETVTVTEGGQNLYAHRLPRRVGHQNLVLERGFVVGSPLDIELQAAMGLLQVAPSNVMVTLHQPDGSPLAGWMVFKAFPVRWATADLDASREQVLIDTIELAYAHMNPLRV